MAAGDPTTRQGLRVSVVVPCYRGESELPGCLESLAHQDLDRSEFEVVVVLNGPLDNSARRIDEARERWPDLILRTVATDRAGAGHARNLGIASAAGEFVTLVDHDDRVSPGFLSGLISAAEPGITPLAQIADVSPEPNARPDYDNYIAQTFLPLAGEVVPLESHSRALGFNTCKLIPTAVARGVQFDEQLRSGEDLVYWYDIANRLSFRLRVLGAEATYYRTIRPNSVSRQGDGFDFQVTQRLDVLEALATRPATGGRGAAHIHQAFVVAQTGHIARYLQSHPDQHDAVTKEIVRRGLAPHVAWRELNRATGPARELAILYAFLPFADTSALVSARRIHERGKIVDVVSNTLRGMRGTDQTGWLIADTLVARHRQVGAPATSFAWRSINAYCRQGLEVVEEWVAEQGPYESLYSRAMQPPSHLLAALVKLRYPQIHWRAEFSDPMAWNPYGERRYEQATDDRLWRTLAAALAAAGIPEPDERNIVEMVELIAYVLADEIVFTNEHQMQFMLRRIQSPALAESVRARSRWEHHPVPSPMLYNAVPSAYDVPSDRVNIAYFGAFYATRGLTEVVEALMALAPGSRSRLQFHVFTSDPSTLAAEVAERDLGDVVRVNGHVPYLQCLNLATRMDVLLVNDARTNMHYEINPYLPSKWSDYVGSGTPIWAIVEPGSVLDGMSVKFKSPLGDVAATVAALEQIAGSVDIAARPTLSTTPV